LTDKGFRRITLNEVYYKNMIMKKIRAILLLILGVFLFSPFFVMAKSCYVDKSGGDGDGSKDKPYKSIARSLDKDCTKIKVRDGKYKESFVLRKGVSLEGEGDDTIVMGKVKMDDDSSLEDVFVDDGGVEILKNAKVNINNVRIEHSHIGIVTVGTGKLTVKNCKIKHNGKGLYLQYGKDVDLQNNIIANNGEEGVDIRANVDGIINGNIIESNKEGGIEVILGKSELKIMNNSIKHNKASGIAVQFYKENSSVGSVTISGNKLVGNGNYGIDCKIPSGGRPMVDYWSKSINFGYNSVSGNGKGSLSAQCKFGGDKVDEATLTKEEIEEKKQKQEREKKIKQEEMEKQRMEEEKKQKEEEAKIKEEKIRVDLWNKDQIVQEFPEEIKRCHLSENDLKILKRRGRWKIFFLGPDEEMIKRYEEREKKCAEVISKMENKIGEIETDEVKKDLEDNYLHKLQQQIGVITAEKESYKNKFGLWKWVRGLFGK